MFARLRASLPGAVWLDSATAPARGRYDIQAAAPSRLLIADAGGTRILSADGREQERRGGDPLTVLAGLLAGRARAPVAGLPFTGGAIGYFGYDLGCRLEGVPSRHPPALPAMIVGLYDWAVVTDHHRGQSALVGPAVDEALIGRIERLRRAPLPAPVLRPHGRIGVDLDRAAYGAAFTRVMAYIRDGDCYQINLARAFRIGYEGDPLAAYLALRSCSPAPYGAFLELPGVTVLSASPERFLRLLGDRVETCPIKGTCARHLDPAADRAAAGALTASAKDRAENVMIVDLLRNDLGKVCATGTVRVPELYRLESFADVHHLVSRVTGRLASGRTAADLLAACLPGGSITGAPKHRAMQIIDELEPGPRGVYCGAIGYLGDDGAMDTSIAIRTAVAVAGTLEYRAGGGLVADSGMQAEYRETEIKAAGFVRMVESLMTR